MKNHPPAIALKIATILATWFGAGRSPKAPGTLGTLAALPFAYAMQVLGGNALLLLFAFLTFLLGIWASRVYMQQTNTQDPGEIVIDEVSGVCLLLAALTPTWQAYLAGFVLFRIFDVLKPWPISLADKRIKGGFGVMFDDTLAALMGILVLLVFWLAFGFSNSFGLEMAAL